MKRLIALLLVLVLIFCCLCACGDDREKEDRDDDVVSSETESGDDTAIGDSVDTDGDDKADSAIDLENPISEYYFFDLRTVEGCEDIVFSVPQINGTTNDILNINSVIKDRFKPYIDRNDLDEFGEISISINIWPLERKFITNDSNYCSLLIIRSDPSGGKGHTVYNLNKFSGTKVSNAELLESLGMSDEEYLTAAKEAAIEACKEYNAAALDAGMPAEAIQQLIDDTVSEENLNINNLMFINENGELCVVVGIAAVAGAAYYEQIVTIS